MPVGVLGPILIDGSRLFIPGGDVHQWCTRVADEMKTAAVGFAPPNRSMSRRGHVGSGKLAASIRSGVTIEAPEILSIELTAGPVFRDARGGIKKDYTEFVLQGTAYQGYRYIYSTVGWQNKREIDLIMRRVLLSRVRFEKGSRDRWYMKLPDGFALRVHGQRKNPFLSDAYYATRRLHSALPRLAGLPPETGT